MIAPSAEECRDNADGSRRAARTAPDQRHRVALFDIARAWDTLAKQTERYERLDS